MDRVFKNIKFTGSTPFPSVYPLAYASYRPYYDYDTIPTISVRCDRCHALGGRKIYQWDTCTGKVGICAICLVELKTQKNLENDKEYIFFRCEVCNLLTASRPNQSVWFKRNDKFPYLSVRCIECLPEDKESKEKWFDP